MSASERVNKVWNYAHVLRDDGVGYGDCVEAVSGAAQASFSTYGLTFSLSLAALEHPCSSQLPINEVPHECV